MGDARVPGFVSQNHRPQNVATHLDYSPSTHPRQLDPSADAQRIIDGLVNGNGQGIPERVAYDGGFRVGRDKHYHADDVVDALKDTSQYYTNLSQREANAGNTRVSQRYRDLAADISRSQVTYAKTTAAYWNGAQTTPRDVVHNPDRGERLIGLDGRPVPWAAGQ